MSEREIFTAARDIADPAARAAYLDTACAGDSVLRARVEALLRADARPDSLLDVPAVAPPEPGSAPTRAFRGRGGAAPGDGPTRTHGEGADGDTDDALGFLSPAGRPDSLGRVGHYEVLEVLGRGGFGVVYRAFDDVLQRVVAVKVLAPSLATTSPARKRFLREARSAAPIQHENVVRVFETGEEPLPYLVMEFVAGETLQDRLDRTGPLEVTEAIAIARQVADGLAAAHGQGLIHRDIKPSNILIERGAGERAKITDFGLARAADDASLTRSGVVAGTPMYMAPEQAKGEALDHRADLFSLGSVLYAMLTGRPPFRAETTLAVLKRVAEDAPRPIREVIPEVPEWLGRVVEKLHAKNPADRFQTAREVADLLADCERQLQAHKELRDPSRIPAAEREKARAGRSRPARLFRAALAVLATVGLIGVLLTIFPFPYLYATNQVELVFLPQGDPDVAQLVVRRDGKEVARLVGGSPRAAKLAPGEYEVEAVCIGGYEATKFHVETRRPGSQSGAFHRVEGRPVIKVTLLRGDTTSIAATAERRAAPVPDPEGFVPLFNGRDLSGWTELPDGANAWKVVDGVLRGQSKEQSLLGTDRTDYRDFHLRIEARIGSRAGGGIFFRHLSGTGYEAEILPMSDKVPTGSLWRHPDLSVLAVAPKEGAPARGEWFNMEVVARGDRILVLVNGRTTADVTDAKSLKGRFALQCQGNGDSVEFRKIEIKELPPDDFVQLFNGRDLAGWHLSPNAPGKWRVENGVLVGSDGPGFLLTDREYRDFHLRAVAKVGAGGNAGVNFRRSLQAEISGLPKAPSGSLVRLADKKAVSFTPYPHGSVPPDTWFTLEVRAAGPKVEIRVNDFPWEAAVAPADGRAHRLQLEATAGTVVEFEKIEIKELPPSSPAPPLAVAPFDAVRAKEHQESWAKHLGVPVEFENAVGMKFRLIPPGEFTMGTPQKDVDALLGEVEEWEKKAFRSEAPPRRVRVTAPAYLGQHEVAVGQFKRFVAETGHKTTAETNGKGGALWGQAGLEWKPEYTWRRAADAPSDEHPVGQVGIDDARAFCAWLGEKDGLAYLVPDEELWEFACRAGTEAPWFSGLTEAALSKVAWYAPNAKGTTHAVGGKQPNAFGLFDVLGNAEELCVAAGDKLVTRGGHAGHKAARVRSAARFEVPPEDLWHRRGFRVAIVGNLMPAVPSAPPPRVKH